MKPEDFREKIMRPTFRRVLELDQTKGRDYSGDADTLSNFKRQAAALDLTPEQVWSVLANKHWAAIVSYCKRGQVESEPIEGRVQDMILYLLLLLAMVREDKEAGAPVPGLTFRSNIR